MASPKLERATTSASEEGRIPDFKSIEEAAEFWETHDSADFEGEWDEVTEGVRWVVTEPNGRIAFALKEREFAALRERAHQAGLGPGSLALQWVLERLNAS
jgi:hypothetical protein